MSSTNETQLIEWITNNMIATENDTLDEHKRKLFIELVEAKKTNPLFIEAYKKLEQLKKVEEENGYGMCDNLCGVVAKFQNKSGKNWCGGYCYDVK